MLSRKRASSSQQVQRTKSGDISGYGEDSPYIRPVTSQFGIVENSSAIWKDFMNGARRRKKLIKKLIDVGSDNGQHSQTLKKMMLDLRQLTLKIVEDAMEIEYRSQFGEIRMREQGRQALNVQLPPITSFSEMNNKQDILFLTEMITDVDDLFATPNIRVLLPAEFPSFRNPLMLAKTIDELSGLDIPKPTPGGENLDQELHVLELLRYKRASIALLKAESQLSNKLPINLSEIQVVFKKMEEDRNAEMLIRIAGTLVLNDRTIFDTSSTTSDLRLLTNSVLHLTDYQLLAQLNRFKGDHPMRADVQAAVKQTFRSCSFEHLTDRASRFLVDWITSVVSIANTHPHSPERRSRISTAMGGSRLTTAAGNNNDLSRIGSAATAMFGPQHQQMSVITAPDFASVAPSLQSLEHNDHMEEFMKKKPILKLNPISRNYTNEADRKQQELQDIYAPTSSSSPPRQRQQHSSPHVNFPDNKKQRTQEQLLNSPNQSMVDGGDSSILSVGGGTKKKMNKDEFSKRVRAEVELILNARMNPNGGGDDDDDDNSIHSSSHLFGDYLSDTASLGGNKNNKSGSKHGDSKKVTKTGTNSLDSVDKPMADHEDFIAERSLAWGEENSHKGMLKLTYDDLSGFVIARMIRIHDRVSVETCDFHEGDEQVLAYSTFSKLLLEQMTGYTLDNLMESPLVNRKRYLDPVFRQLLDKLTGDNPPSGKFYMDCDRILYKSCNNINGILVDIVILRNMDCNGIVLHVIPLQGKGTDVATSITKVGVDTGLEIAKLQSLDCKKSIENGPITISLHDKEIGVLLVNQQGLLAQAKTKWSSMIAVAEWLANRLFVKRIPLIINEEGSNVFATKEGADAVCLSVPVKYNIPMSVCVTIRV